MYHLPLAKAVLFQEAWCQLRILTFAPAEANDLGILKQLQPPTRSGHPLFLRRMISQAHRHLTGVMGYGSWSLMSALNAAIQQHNFHFEFASSKLTNIIEFQHVRQDGAKA